MQDFLDANNVMAVVGVSRDKNKWGYRVWKHLKNEGYTVFALHPSMTELEGDVVYPDIFALPQKPDVVITVVPPTVTKTVVEQCAQEGIGKVWMQPGSEDDVAIEFCEANGIEVVHHACMIRDGLKQEFV